MKHSLIIKKPSPHRNHALLEYCFCLDFTANVVFIGVVFLCHILLTRSLIQLVISNYFLIQTPNASSKAHHEIWFLADNLIADLLEPVELVEAEEIVIANCNIHQPEDLVFSPKVNFHEADTAMLAMVPAKKGRERKFSVSLKQKALKFKKAFSLPRIGSLSL